eukprot:IDg12852t1
MPVENVYTLAEFNSIKQNSGNKLVVVDFKADWCGPCQAIAPVYERLSSKFAGRARFLKVDVDEAQDIAQECQISAMPTFQFYLNGSSVAEMQGADPSRLESTIQQYAPSSSDVSFSGSGHQLGSSSSGPPKVNWETPASAEDGAK